MSLCIVGMSNTKRADRFIDLGEIGRSENGSQTVKTLYLAGPMSGYPDRNKQAFYDAADQLRSLGHEIVSPAEMDDEAGVEGETEPSGDLWKERMIEDIQALIGCDGIVLLDGWRDSMGASFEHYVAQNLGMEVYEWDSEWGELNELEEDADRGTKYDTNKTRYELLPPLALEGVSSVMTHGSHKYDKGTRTEDQNWRKGMRWGRLFGATMRHLWAFWRGEDIDPDSDLHHLDHAAADVMMLREYTQLHPEEDDRPTGYDDR